jgi:hypothetical protein
VLSSSALARLPPGLGRSRAYGLVAGVETRIGAIVGRCPADRLAGGSRRRAGARGVGVTTIADATPRRPAELAPLAAR